MLKKLKESSQMSPLAEYIKKNLHSPSYAGESDVNKSPPSSPRSVSSYSVALVMVTNATTIEEQLASLTRAIEGLTKHVQEQAAQIARLINKADNVDASHVMGKQVEAHDEVEASAKQHYTEKDKSKIEKNSKSSLNYSKPYTPRIDILKMPMGYQPPKFQQFDGKGNPKQHVAHFIETCNNAGTYGDYLVKQFVRLLKDNAFDCLCHRDVHSRNALGTSLYLQGILPRSFEELTTQALDMELSMITSGVEGPPVQELRRNKEKQEMKKGGKPFSKAPRKESMAVNVAPFKLKRNASNRIPFLDSNVPGIFDDLLEANLIDMREMKRSEEAERKDGPKYCKCHRLVGHAIQDCFVFKDNVMQLARQGKISLEEDFAATNAITIKSRHVDVNKDSCNAMHGDSITSNEDTLFEKEDSSNADDCMSTITFTNEDLILGSKPQNRPLFVVGYQPHDPRLQSKRTKGCRHYKDAIDYGGHVVPSTWHQCFKYCRNDIVKKPDTIPKKSSALGNFLLKPSQETPWTQRYPNNAKGEKDMQFKILEDLNNACPKGDFPLSIAELMINATTGHEALSFMDGFSGYNQIRMAPADEELMANPLKYVMAKPVLSDRLARWYLQLQQFEITYVPQKAVKGQVLVDFLADHPMPAEWELSDDLPDEDVLVIEVTPPWKMYFDRASHKEGANAGVVFVTTEGESEKPELLPYHNYAKRLMGWLGDVELEHLSRKDNKQADALAKLASTLSMTDKETHIPICKSWVIPPIFSDDEDNMF
ncbi:UNVERIFIED_CONTAM: hypothetical protein Scaly_1498800 [Sesamum calycinum]|uniref:Uncharacterized protein n=1 Tax=Sesamum calycinum TaxID=2727403 RepID=A0AAW2PU36_9LAMI